MNKDGNNIISELQRNENENDKKNEEAKNSDNGIQHDCKEPIIVEKQSPEKNDIMPDKPTADDQNHLLKSNDENVKRENEVEVNDKQENIIVEQKKIFEEKKSGEISPKEVQGNEAVHISEIVISGTDELVRNKDNKLSPLIIDKDMKKDNKINLNAQSGYEAKNSPMNKNDRYNTNPQDDDGIKYESFLKDMTGSKQGVSSFNFIPNPKNNNVPDDNEKDMSLDNSLMQDINAKNIKTEYNEFNNNLETHNEEEKKSQYDKLKNGEISEDNKSIDRKSVV